MEAKLKKETGQRVRLANCNINLIINIGNSNTSSIQLADVDSVQSELIHTIRNILSDFRYSNEL